MLPLSTATVGDVATRMELEGRSRRTSDEFRDGALERLQVRYCVTGELEGN